MLIVEDCPETPCVRANRARLRQILSAGLDIRWNKEATHFKETDDNVTVFFRDGTSASGQVLIAVDGVYSAIRPQILKRPNDEVLHMHPNPPIAGVLKLSGEYMEQQLRLGHSGWNAFGPGFTVFCGVNRLNIEEDDTVSGDYYWVLSNNESAVRGSSDQELLDYAVAKVQTLEPHFRCVVEKTKVEGVRHSFVSIDVHIIFPCASDIASELGGRRGTGFNVPSGQTSGADRGRLSTNDAQSRRGCHFCHQGSRPARKDPGLC